MSIDVSYLTSDRTAATAPKDKTQLDSKAFMQLLIAQLKNQDPSSPMDTSAMMTQTTQMSTMQSLTELTTNAQDQFALQMRVAAATLVGHDVTWNDANGTTQKGVVSGVSYTSTVPTLTVGTTDVSLDAVRTVTPSSTSAGTSASA
ncbi:flagellar hook assembly protein FlgD [Cellulomonas sp. SG140]|uniref:flagellar hook assembly protein FlgD n=1 Tax=Cellulomonas sp. SG140 TaxID=2976536 RepID=UPI0021E87104|nr:flagellar hook capping FlgD N-terminal domain-containing protein [Cellulomonas sp. SG140]